MGAGAPARRGGDVEWFVVCRRQEYAGEVRTNLVRVSGIVLFYAVELINYRGLDLGFVGWRRLETVGRDFHVAVTALAVAWTAAALAVQFCLRQRFFPALFKYVTTGVDIVFLTSVLILADGPRSPLVVAYFLLIPLAALRFSLPLVRSATAGTVLAYLFLSGYARWFTERDVGVPRYHQLIVVLALVLTGIVLGQAVRRAHAVARDYADLRGQGGAEPTSGEPGS